jgi:hypothetical protein
MKSLLAVLCLLATTTALAQEIDVPQAEPSPEHKWLEKFVGEWTSRSKSIASEGMPAMEYEGAIKSRMLGGLWLINEMKSDTPGMQMVAIQTIGYNTEQKKYVGTWVDSMFNHMWQYQGSVSEDGKTLTLEAEGPNFVQRGQMTKFRDVYEFKADDHIEARSQMQTADGEWVTFMVGQLKRQK